MKQEQLKLNQLLEEEKISSENYEMLRTAIQSKSFFSSIEDSILLNPFSKIAGFSAFALGILFVVLMAIIANLGYIHYPGFLSFHLYENKYYTVDIGRLALQCITNNLVLSLLFYLGAILAKQRSLRFVDFVGTVFLSRFPYLAAVSLHLIYVAIFPELKGIASGVSDPHRLVSVLGISFAPFVVWQCITYWFALKESSGLQGKMLWLVFLISMFLCDVLSGLASRWWVNFYS